VANDYPVSNTSVVFFFGLVWGSVIITTTASPLNICYFSLFSLIYTYICVCLFHRSLFFPSFFFFFAASLLYLVKGTMVTRVCGRVCESE
jgi:fatty-acid desaturase